MVEFRDHLALFGVGVNAGRQYIAVALRVGDAVEIVALARQAATAPGGR